MGKTWAPADAQIAKKTTSANDEMTVIARREFVTTMTLGSAPALKRVETGRISVEDLRFRAGLGTAREKQIPQLRDQSAICLPGENNRL